MLPPRLLGLFTTAVVCASALDHQRVTVEQIPSLAARHRGAWRVVGTPPSTDTIRLSFAVSAPENGVFRLERALLGASDPASPSYGKWLSSGDVQALTVGEDERSQVLAWLAAAEVSVTADPSPGFVAAEVSVAKAEELLHAHYGLWEHAETGARVVRLIEDYSVPAGVPVDFVSPTHRFPSKLTVRVEPVTDGGCCYWRTPDVLRTLYGVDDYIGHGGVRQHVAAFDDQYFSQSDLQAFEKKRAPWALGQEVIRVVGWNNESDAGMEASLDVQTIIALGTNVSTEFWSTAGTAPNATLDEPFLEWLQALSKQADGALPHVVTVSYGDNENSLSPSYARRVSQEFAGLAARGVSVLVASGDMGVGGDGWNADNCTRFIPTFPASSPWVTAVGGATFPHDDVTSEPYRLQDEVAWSGSGGGFSDLFAVPSYQNKTVLDYLGSALLPPRSAWNSTGTSRAYPDVAAQSEKFTITCNGFGISGVSGTSAAAPTFAAIVSLLASRRLAAGKDPRLGLLNPLLYANPDALNDLEVGSNPACGAAGFQSGSGWDPVTGLGTPVFAALSAVVDALP